MSRIPCEEIELKLRSPGPDGGTCRLLELVYLEDYTYISTLSISQSMTLITPPCARESHFEIATCKVVPVGALTQERLWCCTPCRSARGYIGQRKARLRFTRQVHCSVSVE